jgi:hypothetical protein
LWPEAFSFSSTRAAIDAEVPCNFRGRSSQEMGLDDFGAAMVRHRASHYCGGRD